MNPLLFAGITWIMFALLWVIAHYILRAPTWPLYERLMMIGVCSYIAVDNYRTSTKLKRLRVESIAATRTRVYDALVWWSSEGRFLASDSSYLLAAVRQLKGVPSGKAREQIMASYQNESDPCTTVEGSERMAGFALREVPQVVADHVDPAQRDVAGLGRILRRHFRRDVVLMEEARAYQLNIDVHGVADESPTHLVERLLREFNAVSLAREQGLKRIQDLAATMPEEKREQYIAAAVAGINAALDTWMTTQANRAD